MKKLKKLRLVKEDIQRLGMVRGALEATQQASCPDCPTQAHASACSGGATGDSYAGCSGFLICRYLD